MNGIECFSALTNEVKILGINIDFGTAKAYMLVPLTFMPCLI